MQLSHQHHHAPDPDATRRIGLAMSTLLRAAARAKAQDAAAGGVFHSMGVLWVLNESGPLRANLLAEAVHADPSTLSRQVSALADQGLISREPDPADGRATLLSVTDAGRTVLAERMKLREQHLSSLTEAWSARDREQFADLFDRFATAFATSLPHLTDPHRTDEHRTETS
jgi:DNA-binding MarR family transcriptional regulator